MTPDVSPAVVDYRTDLTPPLPGHTIAYLLPFAAFMAFTVFGVSYPEWYAVSYLIKTPVVAAMLWYFWPRYAKIRWTHLPLGVLVGVIGVVQWVGMEKLLMSQPWLSWTRTTADIRGGAFRPFEHFHNAGQMWAFIAVRWAGAALMVPFMEERFWRDYLWRSIESPNDIALEPIGIYRPAAFWIVVAAFATVHPQWLTAIVWAMLVGWLLVKTRSLGACIVAHGVTNFLLGAYVLVAWYGFGRDEWFFW